MKWYWKNNKLELNLMKLFSFQVSDIKSPKSKFTELIIH
jgi:hypothetical protein